MATAADRLQQLSGLAGVSAAAMLLAIGQGATAGELLVSRSGLPTGTAAVHLLADSAVPPAPSSASWLFQEVASTPRRRIEPQPWRPDEEDEAILLAMIH